MDTGWARKFFLLWCAALLPLFFDVPSPPPPMKCPSQSAWASSCCAGEGREEGFGASWGTGERRNDPSSCKRDSDRIIPCTPTCKRDYSCAPRGEQPVTTNLLSCTAGFCATTTPCCCCITSHHQINHRLLSVDSDHLKRNRSVEKKMSAQPYHSIHDIIIYIQQQQ